ncbi:MAG: porin family protein [Gemmatimonadetes bacterium]|nr:porin family protein [Gemmatimonadota bacterium]
MMKRTMWAAVVLAVVGLFGAPPADAQEFPDYKFDVGVFGGGSWYSAMLDDTHLGEGSDDVRYKAGWVTGLQATFWATPRFGIRAHGAYSERPVTGGDDGQQDEDGNLLDDVNLWSASGDLMIRLVPGGYSMAGRQTMPYLALGIGGKNTNPPGDIVLVTDGDDETTGVGFAPEPNNWFFQMSQWTLMGLAALGTDVRLADNFGLRLEVGDRFWDATIRDAAAIAANSDEDVGRVTHEIYGQIGAHLLLGLAAPEVVAVAPAPPPPPAPRPTPPPQPVEESITVCVIDPAAEGGIRTVNAIYLPERGDTMVVVNGQRQALRGTLPRVMLASEADWFVRGEPLQLNLAPDLTLEYTTWQSGRVIPATDLAYLGQVRGLPVYASSNDVRDIRADLAELRRAQASDDLNDILDERQDIRDEIEDIQYLYVPLRPTGCVFQTVQQVEQIIKK